MILIIAFIIVLVILIQYLGRESAAGGYSYGGAYSGPSGGSIGGHGGSISSGSGGYSGYGGSYGGSYGKHSGHGGHSGRMNAPMSYSSAGAYNSWYDYGIPLPYYPRSWVGLFANSYMGLPWWQGDNAGGPYYHGGVVSICEDVGWTRPCTPMNDPDVLFV